MAGFVLMMALSGLGCQNKSCDASVAPADYCPSSQCAAHVPVGSVALTGYPAGLAGQYGDDHYAGYDLGSSVRSTLWSFVLGRDPDGVPTVAEIEAGLESGPNAYSAAISRYNASYSTPIGGSSR
jgi:hypothetical protein